MIRMRLILMCGVLGVLAGCQSVDLAGQDRALRGGGAVVKVACSRNAAGELVIDLKPDLGAVALGVDLWVEEGKGYLWRVRLRGARQIVYGAVPAGGDQEYPLEAWGKPLPLPDSGVLCVGIAYSHGFFTEGHDWLTARFQLNADGSTQSLGWGERVPPSVRAAAMRKGRRRKLAWRLLFPRSAATPQE